MEKLTEQQLLTKLRKTTKNAQNDVKDKYEGLFFFIEQLEQKGINPFKMLKDEYVKLPIGNAS